MPGIEDRFYLIIEREDGGMACLGSAAVWEGIWEHAQFAAINHGHAYICKVVEVVTDTSTHKGVNTCTKDGEEGNTDVAASGASAPTADTTTVLPSQGGSAGGRPSAEKSGRKKPEQPDGRRLARNPKRTKKTSAVSDGQ
jgi:hypothetical protein